jgi:LPS sulfotransferase NodH
MSAVLIPSREFRNAHDQHARLCDEADEADDLPRRAFDEEHVSEFIRSFADSDGNAQDWLQDQGIDRTCIGAADLLRTLCKAWVRDPLAVHAACDTDFWREMKALSYEAWVKD